MRVRSGTRQSVTDRQTDVLTETTFGVNSFVFLTFELQPQSDFALYGMKQF